MYATAGAQVVFGQRDGSAKTEKQYDGGASLLYDAFHPENAPVLDLVYALGQILGDKSTDDVLVYTKTLLTTQTPMLARLAGDVLAMRDIANAHDEARIPLTSTFWDELLDTVVKIADEKANPGLLEDVLHALADDDAQKVGGVFGTYMKFKDRMSYDPANLNGPPNNLETNDGSSFQTAVDRSQPDTGFNRSAFQRFSQLIHDAHGVTTCNKEGAVVHAKGIPIAGSIDIPLIGTYKECEVFKIENLAKFYLDSIIGKANLYFRPNILRNGVLGIGAATVATIEESSGIGFKANETYGFWDATDAKTFHPRPHWLNRLVFFDLANDSPNQGDPNYTTSHFLADLQGPHIGTSACTERVIDDPVPTAPDASPDGKVHGLRDCQDGDWLQQRSARSIFAWEFLDFYKGMAPVIRAFAQHDKEDLLLDLLETVHRHWASDKGNADECKLTDSTSCSKDGMVTYEPLLTEALATDMLSALHDLVPILDATTIKRCTATDPTTHACTRTEDANGIAVLATAARALVDPGYAASLGLKDRNGNSAGMRNDGTQNAQVTPVYLLTNALGAIDKAFDDHAKSHPDDKDRQTAWRLARSQMVDQFLAVSRTGGNASFKNAAVPKIAPLLIDVLRSQMLANCRTSYTPPYDRCAWARDQLTQKASNVVGGPIFASAMDLVDAVRKDDAARTQAEALPRSAVLSSSTRS
jgi:hypothetical protein